MPDHHRAVKVSLHHSLTDFLTLDVVQERSVEGLHARVTQTLGGRPLQVAGLALELKWQDIERMVQRSAQENLESCVNVSCQSAVGVCLAHALMPESW